MAACSLMWLGKIPTLWDRGMGKRRFGEKSFFPVLIKMQGVIAISKKLMWESVERKKTLSVLRRHAPGICKILEPYWGLCPIPALQPGRGALHWHVHRRSTGCWAIRIVGGFLNRPGW